MWERIFEKLLNFMIQDDALVVRFPSGKERRFGDQGKEPVRISVKDTKTVRSLCLDPDMAVGEAYMGETLTIVDDDLHGFLEILMKSVRMGKDSAGRKAMSMVRTASRRIAQHNPIGKAQSNVKHHYDLSDELYELFLDEDRQYSCAYFEDPDEPLELAQYRKKAHIARKLLLQPGHSVLDIGSGWGGMGLTLAREFGCDVQGVTLSSGQHRVSNQRAYDEGMSDRVTFSLMDYRSLETQFDRIVSVGMFEHVGAPHYREFFRNLGSLLKDDGVALLHTIGRSSPPGSTNPWIAKYIFPGGYIPAMSEVLAAIEKESLFVTDVEVLRYHYAETLKNWYDRFMKNIDAIRELYDERFCRMWRFYLVACEMTFRFGGLVVFQFQVARSQQAVPLTRDYIYAGGPITSVGQCRLDADIQ